VYLFLYACETCFLQTVYYATLLWFYPQSRWWLIVFVFRVCFPCYYLTVSVYIMTAWMHFTRATLARRYYLSSCVCLSVRLSITSRCSTETAKRRITQTTPHDSPRTSFLIPFRKSRQNSNGVTHQRMRQCRCGSCKRRLSTRKVVNLARSQVYHTERPPYLFAARSPWCSASRGVCHRQLIVVIAW